MRLSTTKALLPCFVSVIAVCNLVSACRSKAGQIYSPPDLGNAANPPAVSIFAPANGAKFHAHEDVHLIVLVTPHGTSLGPDEAATKKYADESKWHLLRDPNAAVTVEFLAGTNSLGARISSMVSASMRSQHGEAVPMIASLVGYPAVELIWRDASPGIYGLTARATNNQGLITVSKTVNITVLP